MHIRLAIATVLIFLDGNSIIQAPEAKETIVEQSTPLSFHTAKSDDVSSVKCGNLKCFVIMENSDGLTNRGYVMLKRTGRSRERWGWG